MIPSSAQLAILAISFLFALAGATLIVPWILGIWVAEFMRNRRARWVHTPLDSPIAGFLVLAFVAAVSSPMPVVAFESWGLVLILFGVAFPTFVDHLRESLWLVQPIHRAFALGTLCAAIYAMLVLHYRHVDRAQLLTLGPNALGFGLMVGIFMSLPLLNDRFPWPWLAAAALTAASAGLILTFSRGAVYGVVTGAIAYLALSRRRLSLRSVMALAACSVLAIGVVLMRPGARLLLAQHEEWFLMRPVSGVALLSRGVGYLISAEGVSDRVAVWRSALEVIRTHPWSGVGLGVFPFVVHKWFPKIPPGTPPHDLYLNMGAEIGIPGALAFLVIPFTALRYGLNRRDSYRDAQIAALVGILVAEVRDTILMGFHMALGFALILALLTSSPAEEPARAHRLL